MPYMPYHQDPLTSLKNLRSTIFIYNMYIICIFLYHISQYIKFKHDHRVVLMRSQAFGILIWLAISINPERFKSTGLEKNPPRMMLIPNIWNKDPFINTIIMHHAILYYIYIDYIQYVFIIIMFFAHELHQDSSTAPPLAPSRMAKKGAWRCRKGINRHRLVPEICTESVACTWESWGKYRELFQDPERT